jgi:hypothetical protein
MPQHVGVCWHGIDRVVGKLVAAINSRRKPRIQESSMRGSQALFSAEDELSHPPGVELSYSESVYFNFVDDGGELAGLMRIGNRLNARYAEVTVLVYLPEGAAAFLYAKPEIDAPSFNLAGLEIEVVEPLQSVRLSYSGEIHVMADGTALNDPRTAFATSPVKPLSFDLAFDGLMPITGWKFANAASGVDPDGSFAPNHYEAACRVTGTLVLDGCTATIRGQGLRDHSWGPRDWIAPHFYRWISCFTAAGDGFVVWLIELPAGTRSWGFLRLEGETHAIADVAVESEYDGTEHYPRSTSVSFTSGGERFESRGERINIVPLRHRANGDIARLAEVVFGWESFHGARGHGIAEFHDRMTDGVPSGLGHA